MRPQWSRTTKTTIIIFIGVLAIYLLYRFSVIIPPLTIAALLAYILSPLADWASERLRLPRAAAVAGIYVLLLMLLAAAPLLFIPELTRQLNALSREIERVVEAFRRLSETIVVVGQVQIDLGVWVERLSTRVGESLQALAEPTINFLRNVVEFAVFSIVITIVSFYLVKDGHSLIASVNRLVPPMYQEDVRRLRAEINVVWSAFLRGQVILALVVALIWSTVGFVIGLRFALALGILAGLLEFLPSIGHGIWLAIAVVVALIEGSTWLPIQSWAFALLLVGLHVVFQQFDLNYLIPRIIGGQVHLHPLVVILGIIVGASLAGVLGIALAAPVIASARILGRYIYAGLFDLDPFEHFSAGSPQPAERRTASASHD